VGTEEENSRFVQALHDCLQELSYV